MKTRIFLWLAVWAGTLQPIFSQQLKGSEANPQDQAFSYAMADVSYVSDAVFMGRRDSVAAPYMLPSLGYYHKSGFFADASLSYLLAEGEGRVDLVMLSAGYQTTGERWSGGFAATAYFFNEDSYNVQAETSASLTGMLGYDWKVFETLGSISTYMNANEGADLFLGFTLMKDLASTDQDWLVRPQVSIYAGTQRFYEAYYQSSRLGNRKGTGVGSGMDPATSSLVLNDVARFQLLNIEAGLPIHYFHKHWIFSVNPYVAFPQSPASFTTPDFTYTEELDTVFYLTAGLSYWW